MTVIILVIGAKFRFFCVVFTLSQGVLDEIVLMIGLLIAIRGEAGRLAGHSLRWFNDAKVIFLDLRDGQASVHAQQSNSRSGKWRKENLCSLY
jgi:hypothetical protein